MVAESTMICVDNSEWMRNGDFVPTRMQAQQDAANLVLQCKLRSNPESGVGILSMSGKVEVLSTMTQENGKLFMKLHQVQPTGSSNFMAGIRVAHLVLKHRQNIHHRMRIVLFVGSPMDSVEQQELMQQAKRLKKEKVHADVICFGEADSENADKLTLFVDTLNGREGAGSHLVVVPSGSTLTEALVSSPVCRGEDGTAAPVSVPVVGGPGGFEFGVDAAEDPELAMALRVSLEEQRHRMDQEARQTVEAQPGDAIEQPMETVDESAGGGDPNMMNEEQQLEWALRMSMMHGGQDGNEAQVSTVEADDRMHVDADLEAAGATLPACASASTADDEALGKLMNDPEMLRQLVADLPGVDPNSPILQQVVKQTAEDRKKVSENDKSNRDVEKDHKSKG